MQTTSETVHRHARHLVNDCITHWLFIIHCSAVIIAHVDFSSNRLTKTAPSEIQDTYQASSKTLSEAPLKPSHHHYHHINIVYIVSGRHLVLQQRLRQQQRVVQQRLNQQRLLHCRGYYCSDSYSRDLYIQQRIQHRRLQ